MGELLIGFVVTTFGWFISGCLDLSWVVELFSKIFG